MGFNAGAVAGCIGAEGFQVVDTSSTGASLNTCTTNKTDNLIVRIAKRIWTFYKDFQNMMFVAEIVWGAKKLVSLSEALAWGDFLAAVPFLNIALMPLIVPHFIKGLYGKCDTAVTAFRVHYFFTGIKSLGLAIGSLGTTITILKSGILKSGLGAYLQFSGVVMSETLKLVFKSILPPVLLAMTSVAAVFKVWNLGCNLQAYVQYHKAVKNMDTEEGLRAFYDKVMGPKRIVELTLDSTTEAATKKADRVFRLVKGAFIESHASSASRNKEIKALLLDPSVMARLGLELETLQGVCADIEQQNVTGPVRSIIMQVTDLKSLIESDDIWGALDKEIEIYETILNNRGALSLCLGKSSISGNVEALFDTYAEDKADLVEMLRTYQGTVQERGAEVADAMCSEMHRAILNNALTVLMAGLIISSTALALIAPNYALYSIGLGLACGSIDMANILFDKIVGRKKFKKIDLLAYLSHYVHKAPTAYLNSGTTVMA